MKDLTKEISVITQLHLRGYVNWGRMQKNKRIDLLKSMVKKGLLDNNCEPTKKGIELARPKL